jgi:hypothetical protein
VLSIVALLPPFITMFVLTPRALLDFIMVTCLEEYISKSRIQEARQHLTSESVDC